MDTDYHNQVMLADDLFKQLLFVVDRIKKHSTSNFTDLQGLDVALASYYKTFVHLIVIPLIKEESK